MSSQDDGSQKPPKFHTGTVTAINENYGVINGEVYFERALCGDRIPKISEQIQFAAVAKNIKKCTWRATEVRVNPQEPSGSEMKATTSQQINNRKRPANRPNNKDAGLPKVKFSKLQKKKMSKLVKSGVDYEEAKRRMALAVYAKEQGLVQEEEPTVLKERKRLMLVHRAHPRKNFTEQQRKAINNALMTELTFAKITQPALDLGVSTPEIHPEVVFLSFQNDVTEKWIQKTVPKLKPFPNFSWRFSAKKKPPPKRKINNCIIQLPDNYKMPAKELLAELGRDNPGLATNEWRVKNEKSLENGRVEFIFGITPICRSYILHKNSALNLRDRTIRVIVDRK